MPEEAIGAIGAAFEDPTEFDVEFCDADGITLALVRSTRQNRRDSLNRLDPNGTEPTLAGAVAKVTEWKQRFDKALIYGKYPASYLAQTAKGERHLIVAQEAATTVATIAATEATVAMALVRGGQLVMWTRGGLAGRGTARGFFGKSGYELQNLQTVRNTATTIEGRTFSGHALDQMQNRGVVPSVVQNTIKHGTPFVTRPGTMGVYDSVNKIRVILNAENGTVVTVILGSP